MLTLFLSARVPPSTRNWIVEQIACNHRAAIPRLAVPEERSVGAQKSSAATQVTCSHQSHRPRTHNRLTLPFPANFGLKRPFMSQRNEEAHRCHSSSGFSHLHDVSGSVRMVDVSTKRSGLRTAVAEAKVFVSPEICDRWKVDSNYVSLERSSGEGSSVRGVGTNAETSSRQVVSVPACRSVALRSPKGDIFEIAKVAGIMAAKRTSSLIPLCHNLPLLAVEISLTLNESEPVTVETIPATEEEHALRSLADDDNSTKPTSGVQKARVRSRPYVLIRSLVKTHSATGVEMEALTAVTIAGLTVYDMCKSVDKNITLTGVRLVSKRGGKSDFGPLP